MSCDVGEVIEGLQNEAEPHSPTLIASPTSQLILQPVLLLHLHHSLFYNPSFSSPMSQALHLHHLARCPWYQKILTQQNLDAIRVRVELKS